MPDRAVWPDHAGELIKELASAPGRLCLMTGDDAEDAAQELAAALGVRPCQVGRLVTDRASVPSIGTIESLLAEETVLVALDVLFWPILVVDPLALLRSLSRSWARIAVWPGSIQGRRARYSEPGRRDAYDRVLEDAVLLRARQVGSPTSAVHRRKSRSMRYSDLVSFEPVESVKVSARQTRPNARARRRDVRDLRSHGRPARNIIIPALQFERPADQKGVSSSPPTAPARPISCRSSPASRSTPRSRQAPAPGRRRGGRAPIAGRFKVIRFDIGATSLPLRDIVSTEIAARPRLPGRRLHVPRLGDRHQHQGRLRRHDGGLRGRPPGPRPAVRPRRAARLPARPRGRGARSTTSRSSARSARSPPRPGSGSSPASRRRSSTTRVSPASPTRSAESATASSRCGSPGRTSRSSSSERLLRKDRRRSATKIREHLRAFTPLYEGMAEQMDEFVALFPVHPAYLRTFNRHAHGREARGAPHRSRSEVAAAAATPRCRPTTPGLVCHDSYRARLADDPSARTIPEVQHVLDKSDVLRAKVEPAHCPRSSTSTPPCASSTRSPSTGSRPTT